jgi:hypothetical protein|tara:strand:+ start:374 stop:577 length:204 start_codon:yes stop_codon:yes gene_type:complete
MELLIQTIKNKIKNYKTELGNNLLTKDVETLNDYKKIHGMAQGLDKALEIINETVKKYQKGDIEEDE